MCKEYCEKNGTINTHCYKEILWKILCCIMITAFSLIVFCKPASAYYGNIRALLISGRSNGSEVNSDGPIRELRNLIINNRLPGYPNSTTVVNMVSYEGDYRNNNFTNSEIKKQIKQSFKKSTKNDLNIFYFSGHGDSTGIGTHFKIAIKYEELMRELRQYKGTFVVMIESCKSLSLWKCMYSSDYSRFYVITATDIEWNSWSTYMTNAILKGCNYKKGKLPADANKDGFITVSELGEYIRKHDSILQNAKFTDSAFQLFQFDSVNLSESSIKEGNLNIDKGKSKVLTAKLSWTNSNQSIAWKCDDPSIVNIKVNGRKATLTGIKKGSTLVSACITDSAGNKMWSSLRITVKGIPAQSITKVVNEKDGIRVQWPKVPSVEGYKIYRKKGTESWKCIATIRNLNTLSCLDKTAKNGELYTYTVRCFNGAYQGDYNKKGLSVFRLETPTMSTYQSNKQGEVKLGWNINGAATGYQILYSTDSTFKNSVNRVKVKGSKNTGYTVKGLTGGKVYYFRVQSYKYINGANCFGGLCAAKRVKVKSGSSGSGGGCVTPDTLITLSDGSQKRVDELIETDVIKAYDFDTGQITDAPMTLLHHVDEEAEVLRVSFSDGTDIGVVKDHCFFDLTDRCFVLIESEEQAEDLKGHAFAVLDGDSISGIELTDIRKDGITSGYYAPVSEAYLNCFANGLMNMPGYVKGFCNLFSLEDDELKYNAVEKEEEIRSAVEMLPESFSVITNLEVFKTNKLDWLSVSVARGLISIDELKQLYEFCLPFFI